MDRVQAEFRPIRAAYLLTLIFAGYMFCGWIAALLVFLSSIDVEIN